MSDADMIRLRGMGVTVMAGESTVRCGRRSALQAYSDNGDTVLIRRSRAEESEREILAQWGHEWEQVAAHEYHRAETYLRMMWVAAGALAATVPLALWGWLR